MHVLMELVWGWAKSIPFWFQRIAMYSRHTCLMHAHVRGGVKEATSTEREQEKKSASFFCGGSTSGSVEETSVGFEQHIHFRSKRYRPDIFLLAW